jgi:glutamate-1-semialdehyde 2,1-aminomutase
MLAVLRQPGVYERLHVIGQRLANGLRQAGKSAGVPLQVLGDGPVLQVVFTDHQPLRNHRDLLRADKKKAIAFAHDLIRGGVYCTPGGKLYLSLAHSDEDIDRIIAVAAMALQAAG